MISRLNSFALDGDMLSLMRLIATYLPLHSPLKTSDECPNPTLPKNLSVEKSMKYC